MFEPGAKVVCIDGKFTPDQLRFLADLPIEGQTYTVRDIVPGTNWNQTETCAVYLEEILGAFNDHGIERGWSTHRFRELDILPPVKAVNRNRDLVPA